MVASDGASASVVSSFVRSSTGGVTVNSTTYRFDASATGNVLFGSDASGVIDTSSGILGTVTNFGASDYSVYSLDITNMTSGQIDTAVSLVENALQAMTSAASQLGSLSTRIDLQTSFVSALSDSIDSGVGKLVDADMEEESSKLSALQTQQQLAIQSLSIANTSAQNVLSLFK